MVEPITVWMTAELYVLLFRDYKIMGSCSCATPANFEDIRFSTHGFHHFTCEHTLGLII